MCDAEVDRLEVLKSKLADLTQQLGECRDQLAVAMYESHQHNVGPDGDPRVEEIRRRWREQCGRQNEALWAMCERLPDPNLGDQLIDWYYETERYERDAWTEAARDAADAAAEDEALADAIAEIAAVNNGGLREWGLRRCSHCHSVRPIRDFFRGTRLQSHCPDCYAAWRAGFAVRKRAERTQLDRLQQMTTERFVCYAAPDAQWEMTVR